MRTNDISNGQLQENLQSAEVSTTDLERRLMHTFGVEDAGDETAAESKYVHESRSICTANTFAALSREGKLLKENLSISIYNL